MSKTAAAAITLIVFGVLVSITLYLICIGTTSSDSQKEGDQTVQDEVEEKKDTWKEKLTPLQYHVTREHGTERAFTGEFWDHKEDGVYTCVCCGQKLFDSKTKFESGTGWPSFFDLISADSIKQAADDSLAWEHRTELICSKCDAHLGHVFPDGPGPTGLRYCINSAALDFEKREE